MKDHVDQSNDSGTAIHVRVALHADMRKYLAPGEKSPQVVSLPGGATVAELLVTMGIPDSEVVTVGRNGVLAKRDTVLEANDDITMFSPMEGG